MTTKNICKRYKAESLMSCCLVVVVLRQAIEEDGVGWRKQFWLKGNGAGWWRRWSCTDFISTKSTANPHV